MIPDVGSNGPVAATSGTAQAAKSLRWILLALLGAGAVFLAAAASRRFFDRRVALAGVVDVLPAAPPPRSPEPPPAYEISWSRGYFKSDFYLVTADEGGGLSEVARSPAFRWTAEEEPPQADAIAAAHAALVARLVAEGWVDVGGGKSWYARRYRHRADLESAKRPSRRVGL